MSASDLVGASDKVTPPVTEVNGGFPLYIFVINIFSCHLQLLDMLYCLVKDVDLQETRKDAVRGEKVSDALEEKTVEQEHFAYANKLVCGETCHNAFSYFCFLIDI